MMAEGIIYPFVYFGVYSPMIAAIALFVSVPTVALANLYGDRPAASKSLSLERPRLASTQDLADQCPISSAANE